MAKLVIEGQQNWPGILLDEKSGRFEITGRSIPENAWELFAPVLAWLDRYVEQPNARTYFKFHLQYFNTTTSKYLVDVLRKLEWAHQTGKSSVQILWYYDQEDSDIEEAGTDYATLIRLPFKIIEVNENGHVLRSVDNNVTTESPIDASLPKPAKASIAKEDTQAQRTQKAAAIEELQSDFEVVTAISDRLQKKLNQANEQLKKQADEIKRINSDLEDRNTQLQETVDELTRAKISKKAATIVLFIALFLFVISEIIEYFIEEWSENSVPIYGIFILKLLIALLFKPIEDALENNLLKNLKKSKKA